MLLGKKNEYFLSTIPNSGVFRPKEATGRSDWLVFTKKALQITNWLGTDAYLFVPGAVDIFFMPEAEVVPYDVCYHRATQAISQLLPTAEKLGVSVAVENGPATKNTTALVPMELINKIST